MSTSENLPGAFAKNRVYLALKQQKSEILTQNEHPIIIIKLI